jgi:hypothetical protein
MSIELVIFLIFVFMTFFNHAIQWYTHIESYPLQAYVGRNEYLAYGEAYERRLVLALYIPFFIMLACNLVLLFTHPVELNVIFFIVTFIANLSIPIVSFALAVPLHRKHAEEGHVTAEGVREILHVNLLRLLAATLSSVIVLYLLIQLLI